MMGNVCLLGQVASLMEALHLSYHEVLHQIPYRNLIIMNRDKLRPCYGTKVHRISGKEMAAKRMAAMAQSRTSDGKQS